LTGVELIGGIATPAKNVLQFAAFAKPFDWRFELIQRGIRLQTKACLNEIAIRSFSFPARVVDRSLPLPPVRSTSNIALTVNGMKSTNPKSQTFKHVQKQDTTKSRALLLFLHTIRETW